MSPALTSETVHPYFRLLIEGLFNDAVRYSLSTAWSEDKVISEKWINQKDLEGSYNRPILGTAIYFWCIKGQPQ
jgi:hypothetical protein